MTFKAIFKAQSKPLANPLHGAFSCPHPIFIKHHFPELP